MNIPDTYLTQYLELLCLLDPEKVKILIKVNIRNKNL